MDAKDKWTRNTGHEVEFWRSWVTDIEYLRARTESVRHVPESIRAKIPAKEGEPVRLLEIGCGPMTILGNYWEGRTVEVHAVDPLADEYNRILNEKGITPPIRTVECFGEELTRLFPHDYFDYAMAYNCLDHAYDPIACIEQMIKVVKRGSVISLTHYRNEGKNENYSGLHQWNFDLVDHTFFISSVDTNFNVNQIFQHAVSSIDSKLQDNNLVCVEITK